jgi:hypothetical protein
MCCFCLQWPWVVLYPFFMVVNTRSALKEFLRMAGISSRQLAHAMQCSDSLVFAWLNGHADPGKSKIKERGEDVELLLQAAAVFPSPGYDSWRLLYHPPDDHQAFWRRSKSWPRPLSPEERKARCLQVIKMAEAKKEAP